MCTCYEEEGIRRGPLKKRGKYVEFASVIRAFVRQVCGATRSSIVTNGQVSSADSGQQFAPRQLSASSISAFVDIRSTNQP